MTIRPEELVKTTEALLPCEGECEGTPTRHFFSRLLDDPEAPAHKPAKSWDVFFKCYACGGERQWGLVSNE